MIEDFESAKKVLSAKEEFGPPLMDDYIDLLEKEANVDFTHLKKYLTSFLPFMHGEEHLKIRKTINRLFTRVAVRKWQKNIEEAVDYRLSQLESNSSLDLIVDILDPLYIDLVEILFGVKVPDRKKFIRQIEIATNAVERMASVSQLLKLQDVLIELDDLVSSQLNTFEPDTLFAEIVSNVKNELCQDKIVASLIVLLIAPRATTETIAHIMVAFNDLDKESIDRYSSTVWVDEHVNDLIRLYASTNILSKEVKKNTEVNGCPMSSGSQVLINIPAVNRDKKTYGEHTSLEKLNAESNKKAHLTFGSGAHICLGSELAKDIIKEFIPKFFSKYPEFSCEKSNITYYKAYIATRIKNLPVRLK